MAHAMSSKGVRGQRKRATHGVFVTPTVALHFLAFDRVPFEGNKHYHRQSSCRQVHRFAPNNRRADSMFIGEFIFPDTVTLPPRYKTPRTDCTMELTPPAKARTMECEPKKFPIGELVRAWNESSSLKINEEYQRGASWTQPQKQCLIDSVFRKYPIPPLFLHRIISVGLGGEQSVGYEIVDGQQRIRALAEFFSDKFPLLHPEDKKLKLPNSLRSQPAPWAKRRFSDLDGSHRVFLEQTSVDAFVITSVTDTDEVRDLFIRLQSGTALSRQQIRDAWPGNMGPYIESLAGKLTKAPRMELFQLLDKRGARSEDDRDRYDADRQFCAQLLCLFLARENDPCIAQSVGPNDLDKLYHENTVFNAHGPAATRFVELLEHATKVLNVAKKKSSDGGRTKGKFVKPEIFSTFMFLQDISRNRNFRFDHSAYAALAKNLLTEREIDRKGKSSSGPAIAAYYERWREDVLPGIGIHLDPNRAFSDPQKQEIYTKASGKCAICNDPVESGDDEYDHHPVPYAVGGPTTVENGRLVHRTCHPRGRMFARVDSE
ncbi:MAG: HNH endonuclease family protein [Planctomycetaceae bacterium]